MSFNRGQSITKGLNVGIERKLTEEETISYFKKGLAKFQARDFLTYYDTPRFDNIERFSIKWSMDLILYHVNDNNGMMYMEEKFVEVWWDLSKRLKLRIHANHYRPEEFIYKDETIQHPSEVIDVFLYQCDMRNWAKTN